MLGSQNAGLDFSANISRDSSVFGVNQLPDILGLAKGKLQQAAASPDLFPQVFGAKANTSAFRAISQQWAAGNFTNLFPAVQVLSATDMNGAFGAFASSTKTAYLSDGSFKAGSAPTNSPFGAVGVLVGLAVNWLDDRVGGADTTGDEGDWVKESVFNVPLSSTELSQIKARDNRGFIKVNGQQVAVERDATTGSTANTLQTAKNIGILGAASQVFTGSVSASATDRYLKLQVAASSVFNAVLSGQTRNVDIRLLDAQGTLIQGSFNTGTATDSIRRTLIAGTYYLDIRRETKGEVVVALPGADVTRYSLNLSAPPPLLPFIPPATNPVVPGIPSIPPGGGLVVPATPFVRVTSPNGGNSVVRGGVANITWQDNIAENVRIDLYKGGIFYRNITTSTPSTGSFNWTVPTDIVPNVASSTPNWVSLGSDYEIRIRSVTNSAVIDSSDARFNITGKQSNDLFGSVFVLTQKTVKAGDTVNYAYTVRNDGTDAVGASKVGLYLSSEAKSTTGDIFLGEINVGGLAAKTTSAVFKGTVTLPSQGNGFYKGDKSYFIKAVADYKNVIVETNEANNAGQTVGNDYGAIAVTDTKPFVRVTSPNGGIGILRGGVANITWQDNIAENVRIDLYKGGIFYRNITTSTPSTGSFNWTVPTDIVPNVASSTPNWVSLGSDYEIRIRSVTNSAVIDSSDAKFSITGKQSNDLFGSVFVLTQKTVKAGDTVNYAYTVRNDGTDAVGASKVGLYLSSDAKSTTGDIFLGEINVGGLAAKTASAVFKGTVTLPSQGNVFYKGDKAYFVKAVADYKNVIAETNEANNAGQTVGNDYGAIAVTSTALAVVIDNAGDTRATAKNLGTLTTSSVTFSDRIGKGDKEDFISFYVAEPLKANIEIKPVNVVSAGTIGLKLFYPSDISNPNNSSSFYSTNTFSQDYIFNQVGWYYLQLSDTNDVVDAGYTLSVKTNSFVSDIGTLNGNLNAVGNSNKDLYRFKVDQNSIVKASTNLPNGISLKVKDSNYNDIGLRPDIGTTLKAGTYYLQTSPTYDPVTYNPYTIPSSFALNLQATPTVRYDNAGFNYSSAFDIGTITNSKSVTDYIDRTDGLDYYSFTVGSKSSVSLNVVPIVGKATLGVSLYNDKYGSIKSVSNYYDVPPQTLTMTLEAGKYYVQINNTQSDTDVQYRLDVNTQSLVANDAIANSYDQIKDLGYLDTNTPVTLKDAIGGSDPADWMKFNVGTLGNVSTAFSGLTTPITLQLSRIEANGSLTSISTQNSGGQANWTPVFSNLVGNYALVVSSSNSTSTPYTLNLSTVSTNVAPTNVKWNFSGTYQSNQDVIVTGTVSDANGALDLDEAKFYLQSKDGSFRQTFTTKNFTQSATDSRVANFSINLGKLPVGQYVYQSDVYDKSRASANTGTTIYLNGGYAAEVVYTAANSGLQVAPEILPYYSALSSAQQNKLGAPVFSNAAKGKQDFQGGNITAWDGSTPTVYFYDGSSFEIPKSGGTTIISQPNNSISTNRWKAEYFNGGNPDSGTAIKVEDAGDGSQTLNLNWGGGSPSGVPNDNFSARFTTTRYLTEGLYRITTNSDDGIQVFVGNTGKRVEQWIDKGAGDTYTGYFYVGTGSVPITVKYYEKTGGASVKVEITPFSPNSIQEPVNVGTNWAASVFTLNGENLPNTDFYLDSTRKIASVDLGSATRSDGKKGINFNYANRAFDENSNLPHDNYAVRAYTQAYFDGGTYKFRVSGDDAFQIFARKWSGGDTYIASSSSSWTQGYQEYTVTLAAGSYDLHFQYVEQSGNANFDLSWEKVTANNPVSFNLTAGFRLFTTGIGVESLQNNFGISQTFSNFSNNGKETVWTKITPEAGNENKEHLVSIDWGSYRWEGVVTLPKQGQYLTFWRESTEVFPITITVTKYGQGLYSKVKSITEKTKIEFGEGEPPVGGLSIKGDGKWSNTWNSTTSAKINSVLDNLLGAFDILNKNVNPGQCVSFAQSYVRALGIEPPSYGGAAKDGFNKFAANIADKIDYSKDAPKVGDLIFFDATPDKKDESGKVTKAGNPYGHVAVIQSIVYENINGKNVRKVIIQDSNGDGMADMYKYQDANGNYKYTSNPSLVPNQTYIGTYVSRYTINLDGDPPASGLGTVLGGIRLKSDKIKV